MYKQTFEQSMAILRPNRQTVYAGFISTGDYIMADDTAYKIEFTSEESGMVVLAGRDIRTNKAQDLRYRKYTEVSAVISRWAELNQEA